jgi:hypothetical protein
VQFRVLRAAFGGDRRSIEIRKTWRYRIQALTI